MSELLKEIKQLLKETKDDQYAMWGSDWQQRAVGVINNYYYDNDNYDDIIYSTASDEWDEICARQLESRAWQGLMFFLQDLTPSSDWAYIDAYGNACETDAKGIVGALEEIQDEIKRGGE